MIFGKLNINSVSFKFDQLRCLLQDKVDNLVIISNQFLTPCYSKPLRFDRNRNGGGILYEHPDDVARKCLEIILRKNKWLLFATYHPFTQADEYFFDHVGKSL